MLSITTPKHVFDHNLKAKFKLGIKEGAYKAGQSIRSRIVTMLGTGTRTGIHYPNLPNRSSAREEFPRTQSGALARSVYYMASSTDMRIGSTEKHASYLTYGYKVAGKWRLYPRMTPKNPFFVHAMNLEEANTERLLREGVEKRIC